MCVCEEKGRIWAAALAGLGRLKKEEGKIFGELENEEKERVCWQMRFFSSSPLFIAQSLQ